MVVATIQIWPNGRPEGSRVTGIVIITNDNTGDKDFANYDVTLTHSGKYFQRKSVWKTGKVKRHRRSLSPYHLLYNAIGACIKGI